MKVEKLVPKIRFQGFTEEWEAKKLGEILLKIGDGLHGTPIYNINGNTAFVNGNNLINGKIVINKETKMVDNFQQSKNDKSLNDNTILMSINGTIGNLAYYNNENVMLSKSVAFLETNKYSKLFIYQLLQSEQIIYYFINNLTGTTIKNLGLKIIRKTPCKVPKEKMEQENIGNLLKKIDQLIALQQQKIALLELLKKAFLQKMFASENQKVPEIRFVGFNDEWEHEKLVNLGHAFSGLSGKSKKDFGHGKAKFVTYMNVFKNPLASLLEVEPIEIDNKQHEIKYGDVFFTISSETPMEVGMSSVWKYNSPNVYLNSFCFGYRLDYNFDLNYLAFMLRSNDFRKKVIILAQGISRFNISKNKLLNIEIFFPMLKEQQKIGVFFEELDQLISTNNHKLTNLKSLKKSLLQNMFI